MSSGNLVHASPLPVQPGEEQRLGVQEDPAHEPAGQLALDKVALSLRDHPEATLPRRLLRGAGDLAPLGLADYVKVLQQRGVVHEGPQGEGHLRQEAVPALIVLRTRK